MGQGCSETGESGRTRGAGAEADRRSCLVSWGHMRTGAAERRRESGREAGRGKGFAGLSVPNWAEDKKGWLGCLWEKELGRGNAGWAERWEGKEEEKAGKRAGPLRIAGLDFFFPFSFFFFKQTQTTLKLFEFKFEFEFNPSTQTNKTMHQHECTTKLALK